VSLNDLLAPYLVPLSGIAVLLLVAAAGLRGGRLDPARLRPALAGLLEWLGLCAVFTLLDVAAGVVLVLALRAAGVFLSFYAISVTGAVVAMAAAQATLLRLWSPPEDGPGAAGRAG